MQNCYYHQKSITSFCTHPKCTLPLCQDCISIHSKQTQTQISHDMSRHVLPFDDAVKKAIGWIRTSIQDKNKALSLLNNKISQLRQRIICILDQQLSICHKQIDEYLQLSVQQQNAKQSEYKIQEGSMKELIQTYEHYGWVENNIASTQSLKKIREISLDFNFSCIKSNLSYNLPDVPKKESLKLSLDQCDKISSIKPVSPSIQLSQQRSPRRKGVQICSNILPSDNKIENSEVFTYKFNSNRNTDSWRDVVNTKDMYFPSNSLKNHSNPLIPSQND